MAKPLPTPQAPASTEATRVMRSIQALAARHTGTPAEREQKVVDLLHIMADTRAHLAPALVAAIDGGVPYRPLAERTGLVRSAIQRWVKAGREAAV